MKYVLSALLLAGAVSTCQAEVLLEDTLGQSTPMSALKGKWVLINYWAGWCASCIAEIPEFNRFYQKHQKDPVALFAVNFDTLPLPEQNSLIRRLNINYPNLAKDPANELSLGDIVGVPVTFVINPEGKLVQTLYGRQTAKSLEQVIGS